MSIPRTFAPANPNRPIALENRSAITRQLRREARYWECMGGIVIIGPWQGRITLLLRLMKTWLNVASGMPRPALATGTLPKTKPSEFSKTLQTQLLSDGSNAAGRLYT